MHPNGKFPSPPLNLRPEQRTALLDKLGLSKGWLILSLSEMLGLRKAMTDSTAENQRLNKELTRLLSERIQEGAVILALLTSAKETIHLLLESAALSSAPVGRIDALNQIALLDEAIAALSPKNPGAKA